MQASPTTQQPSWRGFYDRNRALAYVLLAQIFGTFMSMATRLLELDSIHGPGMHPFQILLVRFAISTLLSTAYMWYARIPHFPLGVREVRPLLLARGVGSFFGVVGLYYSLQHLPLADATVLTFLAPSLSSLAGSLIHGDPFTLADKFGASVSFVGVVLIAEPTSLFAPSPAAATASAAAITPRAVPLAAAAAAAAPMQRLGAIMVALLGVLGTAAAFTAMRTIGPRAHPLLGVNYFSAICLVVSGLVVTTVPGIPFLLPSGAREWTCLVSLGGSGFAMQALLSAGLQRDKSGRAAGMVYMQMLFALVCDWGVWGVVPSVVGMVGGGLILGSAVCVAVRREAGKLRLAEEKARLVGAGGAGVGDLEMQGVGEGGEVEVVEEDFELGSVVEEGEEGGGSEGDEEERRLVRGGVGVVERPA